MAKNKYYCKDGYVNVYLSNADEIMLIDWDDWLELKRVKWHLNDKGYAQGKLKGKKIIAHRHINKCPPGYVVDHIDFRKLNNLKRNLRNCTPQENNFNRPLQKNNTSGVPGVSYIKKNKRWKAEIYSYGNYEYLGSYKRYEDAVDARREAELRHFGRFAPVI